MKVTLRFNLSDDTAGRAALESLITAWLEDEGVTIHHAGHTTTVDLTYVKEG